MSVRPRNSPNLQACEIGDANKNTEDPENNENHSDQSNEQKEDEKLNKSTKLKLYSFYAIMAVLVIGILALTYYLGTLTSTLQNASSSSAGKMELKMHWEGEKDVLNKYGEKDGDACVIMAECFESYAADYIKSPLNPYKSCHTNLKYILANYDNGFYYEGSRLIGFISSRTTNDAKHSKMLIYNVCIRKEDRGKKVGKLMVPEFIKTVADKRVPKTAPKVYVGLTVNFKSETSNSAFALYAKLGFIRWWQLCEGISQLDFKILEDQESKAKANSPEYDFPMAKYILGGKDFIKTQVTDGKGKVFEDLCMIMLMEKDDFGLIGKNIKEVVKSAIKQI